MRQIQLILPGIIIFLACCLPKESLIPDLNQLRGFPVKIPIILALGSEVSIIQSPMINLRIINIQIIPRFTETFMPIIVDITGNVYYSQNQQAKY